MKRTPVWVSMMRKRELRGLVRDQSAEISRLQEVMAVQLDQNIRLNIELDAALDSIAGLEEVEKRPEPL